MTEVGEVNECKPQQPLMTLRNPSGAVVEVFSFVVASELVQVISNSFFQASSEKANQSSDTGTSELVNQINHLDLSGKTVFQSVDTSAAEQNVSQQNQNGLMDTSAKSTNLQNCIFQDFGEKKVLDNMSLPALCGQTFAKSVDSGSAEQYVNQQRLIARKDITSVTFQDDLGAQPSSSKSFEIYKMDLEEPEDEGTAEKDIGSDMWDSNWSDPEVSLPPSYYADTPVERKDNLQNMVNQFMESNGLSGFTTSAQRAEIDALLQIIVDVGVNGDQHQKMQLQEQAGPVSRTYGVTDFAR